MTNSPIDPGLVGIPETTQRYIASLQAERDRALAAQEVAEAATRGVQLEYYGVLAAVRELQRFVGAVAQDATTRDVIRAAAQEHLARTASVAAPEETANG